MSIELPAASASLVSKNRQLLLFWCQRTAACSDVKECHVVVVVLQLLRTLDQLNFFELEIRYLICLIAASREIAVQQLCAMSKFRISEFHLRSW